MCASDGTNILLTSESQDGSYEFIQASNPNMSVRAIKEKFSMPIKCVATTSDGKVNVVLASVQGRVDVMMFSLINKEVYTHLSSTLQNNDDSRQQHTMAVEVVAGSENELGMEIVDFIVKTQPNQKLEVDVRLVTQGEKALQIPFYEKDLLQSLQNSYSEEQLQSALAKSCGWDIACAQLALLLKEKGGSDKYIVYGELQGMPDEETIITHKWDSLLGSVLRIILEGTVRQNISENSVFSLCVVVLYASTNSQLAFPAYVHRHCHVMHYSHLPRGGREKVFVLEFEPSTSIEAMNLSADKILVTVHSTCKNTHFGVLSIRVQHTTHVAPKYSIEDDVGIELLQFAQAAVTTASDATSALGVDAASNTITVPVLEKSVSVEFPIARDVTHLVDTSHVVEITLDARGRNQDLSDALMGFAPSVTIAFACADAPAMELVVSSDMLTSTAYALVYATVPACTQTTGAAVQLERLIFTFPSRGDTAAQATRDVVLSAKLQSFPARLQGVAADEVTGSNLYASFRALDTGSMSAAELETALVTLHATRTADAHVTYTPQPQPINEKAISISSAASVFVYSPEVPAAGAGSVMDRLELLVTFYSKHAKCRLTVCVWYGVGGAYTTCRVVAGVVGVGVPVAVVHRLTTTSVTVEKGSVSLQWSQDCPVTAGFVSGWVVPETFHAVYKKVDSSREDPTPMNLSGSFQYSFPSWGTGIIISFVCVGLIAVVLGLVLHCLKRPSESYSMPPNLFVSDSGSLFTSVSDRSSDDVLFDFLFDW